MEISNKEKLRLLEVIKNRILYLETEITKNTVGSNMNKKAVEREVKHLNKLRELTEDKGKLLTYCSSKTEEMLLKSINERKNQDSKMQDKIKSHIKEINYLNEAKNAIEKGLE